MPSARSVCCRRSRPEPGLPADTPRAHLGGAHAPRFGGVSCTSGQMQYFTASFEHVTPSRFRGPRDVERRARHSLAALVVRPAEAPPPAGQTCRVPVGRGSCAGSRFIPATETQPLGVPGSCRDVTSSSANRVGATPGPGGGTRLVSGSLSSPAQPSPTCPRVCGSAVTETPGGASAGPVLFSTAPSCPVAVLGREPRGLVRRPRRVLAQGDAALGLDCSARTPPGYPPPRR